jgi:hypothetical protein
MSSERKQCETVFCSNGWVEIRDPDRGEQWIATDTPAEVER